jgi:hypothetical protein
VARGFESKDIEFQQAEAERRQQTPRHALTAEEREAASRRQTIRLALAKARADLAVAREAGHRHMLEEMIAALERQLR